MESKTGENSVENLRNEIFSEYIDNSKMMCKNACKRYVERTDDGCKRQKIR